MAPVEDLERQLAAVWENARVTWPTLHLSPESFISYLAQRLPIDLPPARRIASLVGPDLYLACGCAGGEPEAIALFERHLKPELEAALRRLTAPPHLLSEIVQSLNERLLVPHPETGATITKYSGRGQLKGWLRVLGVRAAIKALDREMKEIPVLQSVFEDLPAAAEDPELQLLRETYQTEFRLAFRTALSSLPGRDRALLKMHFFDDLTVDGLGKALGVHRATAARWLAKARQTLLERTEAELSARLGMDRGEVSSILHLIDNRLAVTFRSLLPDGGEPL